MHFYANKFQNLKKKTFVYILFWYIVVRLRTHIKIIMTSKLDIYVFINQHKTT